MATEPNESGWVDSNGALIVGDGDYTYRWLRPDRLEIDFRRPIINSIVLATARSDPDKNCDTSTAWVKICDRTGNNKRVWLTLDDGTKENPKYLGIQFVVFDIDLSTS